MLAAEILANVDSRGPRALDQMRAARRKQQDAIAAQRGEWIESNRYFYNRIKRLLRYLIDPGKRVLQVRCQTGHLLNAVEPSYGVGVELGEVMVDCARKQFPQFHFVQSDPEDLDLGETFDYVLFDHIFDTVDILKALEQVRHHCTTNTRIVVINYNHLWQPVLEMASEVRLRSRFVEPNWVSEHDLRGFLGLAGFLPIRTYRLCLFPKYLPLISAFMNDCLGRLPGLDRLNLMQVTVARLAPEPLREEDVTVSVVVPCRNEEGNVQQAVERIPAMGHATEILFCDDRSTDGTADEVRRMQDLYPEREIRLIPGPGICKAQNVWTGFRAARGDVLMILDADLSVMPEELPVFLRTLLSGRGDFINGSRLVYPMQRYAMKFANMIGNKFFSQVFSFLLNQRIKDTLCGTKVLWRRDWMHMEPHLGQWGIQDLWGDYELLFGASRLSLRILDVPVHYQERVHGLTKMNRVFANGMRMLRICWHAWGRLSG